MDAKTQISLSVNSAGMVWSPFNMPRELNAKRVAQHNNKICFGIMGFSLFIARRRAHLRTFSRKMTRVSKGKVSKRLMLKYSSPFIFIISIE